MEIPTDLQALVGENRQINEKLTVALQEHIESLEKMDSKVTVALQEHIESLEKINSKIGGFYNLNELNKTTSSRAALPFEKEVTWYDDGIELENKIWEQKKEYELKANPRQENLVDLVDMFIHKGYKLSISDPHCVLSLPIESQSYAGRWFVGWAQELYIHAKKIDEEVLVKKEVMWYGPVTFWYTGMHYLVNIHKNKSKIKDKTLLNLIKYGETNPSFIVKMAKQGTADKHIFEKWTHDYVHRSEGINTGN